MILAATTQQSVAGVIGAVLFIGWIVYIASNISKAKPEIGSEIELAANRTEYLSDDELESSKLDQSLSWGLIWLVIIGLGLPLYWLNEPNRQTNDETEFKQSFVSRGEGLYEEFGCNGCHGAGGVGGVAPYTVVNDDGTFDQFQWAAPALNDVYKRFDQQDPQEKTFDERRQEIRTILVYGRPGSPMPAWGTAGGGALTDQQIENLMAYLESIQITDEEAIARNTELAQGRLDQGEATSEGEALFQVACARCHTKGYSIGQPEVSGGGALGPNLTNGATVSQFPDAEDHLEFILGGSNYREGYGERGIGSGGMPGFEGSLTRDQVQAIVDYERSLLMSLTTLLVGAGIIPGPIADLFSVNIDGTFVQGLFAVLTGVVILMGSIFLIIGTNTGNRLGLLITLSALFGWMTIMGAMWTAYGIGWRGRASQWVATEVFEEEANAELVQARDLSQFEVLEEGNPARGDAVAVAEAYLIDAGEFDAANEFMVEMAYRTGGEDYWIANVRHKPAYAVVQVRGIGQDDDGLTGEVDLGAPAVHVAMTHDLGTLRLTPGLFTVAMGILFAVTAYQLHERDKRSMAAVAASA